MLKVIILSVLIALANANCASYICSNGYVHRSPAPTCSTHPDASNRCTNSYCCVLDQPSQTDPPANPNQFACSNQYSCPNGMTLKPSDPTCSTHPDSTTYCANICCDGTPITSNPNACSSQFACPAGMAPKGDDPDCIWHPDAPNYCSAWYCCSGTPTYNDPDGIRCSSQHSCPSGTVTKPADPQCSTHPDSDGLMCTNEKCCDSISRTGLLVAEDTEESYYDIVYQHIDEVPEWAVITMVVLGVILLCTCCGLCSTCRKLRSKPNTAHDGYHMAL